MVLLAHYRGTKYFTFLVGIVFILWPTFCFSSQNLTNARLVKYTFGRFEYSYYLLIPDNIQEYTYLSHYPLTAFLFLHYFDKKKIANLTVKELKSGSLGNFRTGFSSDNFYDVLKYDKLKGFEKIAENLTKIDEFQIAENKSDIIAELSKVYDNYRKEYLMYLKGIEGTYKFRKDNFDIVFQKKLEEYSGTVQINEPSPRSSYKIIGIENYDLDKQVFSIESLSPISIIGLSIKTWEYHYKKMMEDKYNNMELGKKPILQNIVFPDEVQIHLSVEDAKKLFKRKDKVYCETIVTVEPEEGIFGYEGNTIVTMTSNFSILNIIKNYYEGRTWSPVDEKFIGEPIYSIQLESNGENTFHKQ